MRLCVFCGSSAGRTPAYAVAGRLLGVALARRGIGLVYGGGNVGLMGLVADAALAEGGEVIGVIPRALVDRELAHGGVSELRVVDSMHARKQLMHDLSDGFIALPGGFGTLDELFETLTWAQLGVHAKPCGLLDVEVGHSRGELTSARSRVRRNSGRLNQSHRKVRPVRIEAAVATPRLKTTLATT